MKTKTTVVNMRTYKRNDYVLIDRRTKWGNPFMIGRDGTRDDVIIKYKNYIMEKPELLGALHELEGKILGCWCVSEPITEYKGKKVCHGQILLELIGRNK